MFISILFTIIILYLTGSIIILFLIVRKKRIAFLSISVWSIIILYMFMKKGLKLGTKYTDKPTLLRELSCEMKYE